MIAGPATAAGNLLHGKHKFSTPAEKIVNDSQQDAGYRAVIAHAEQCGLRQWQLSNEHRVM